MEPTLKKYKCLSITHKNVRLKELGQFMIPENQDHTLQFRLRALKDSLQLDELLYLPTCNRVMYFFTGSSPLTGDFLDAFLKQVNPDIEPSMIDLAETYEGENALRHLLEVASSLHSMVVGEREIHKQLRLAFDDCRRYGLTGDDIRVAVRKAVETAKLVFTHTRISEKPVSVVSLAMAELEERVPEKDTQFLIVGAGTTNSLVAKFLLKMGYRHFSIFNRTLKNAQLLADKLNGEAYELADLPYHNKPFDVLITCTGATEPVITEEVAGKLLKTGNHQKLLIDLAVPHDVESGLTRHKGVSYIEIEWLKEKAEANLGFRKQEVERAMKILDHEIEEFAYSFRMRQVERAMSGVSSEIRKIREHALEKVFTRELDEMDKDSREVLDKVLCYMEKKYVSIPMTVAKEAFVKK